MNEFGITYSTWITGIMASSFTAIANIDTDKDGTVQTAEAFNAVQTIVLQALSNTPENFDLVNLKNEVSDIDPDEKFTLKQEFIRIANVKDNPYAEQIAEKIFSIFLDTLELVFFIKQKPVV